MKHAIIPSIISWLVGIVAMMVIGYLTMPKNYYTSEPTRDFFLALRFYAFYLGIVIFPACFALAPSLKRHLPAAGDRKILVATRSSALAGLLVMLFLELFVPFMPRIWSSGGFLCFGAAALVGASFGFSYAILYRQTPNA